MTHLQKIEAAILEAQSKIHSYRMCIALFTGIPDNPADEIISQHRGKMVDSLLELYQAIEPSVKVPPTPTMNDNTVTRAEEFYL